MPYICIFVQRTHPETKLPESENMLQIRDMSRLRVFL